MTQSNLGVPYVDPTAQLSDEHKKAASKAGYALPFLSPDAEYLMKQAEKNSHPEVPGRAIK